MTEGTQSRRAGWTVVRSIAMELDSALSFFSGYDQEERLSPQAAALVRMAPADWKAQWPEMLGSPRRWISVLGDLARAAGVLAEEDYSRATLAMRELTLADCLAHAANEAAKVGLPLDEALPPVERLTDIATRAVPVINQAVGLEQALAAESLFKREASYETSREVRILRDGDLHARFWLWLDRFYFECYRPWREGKLEAMAQEEQRAIAALGARERAGEPPETGWLPAQNPLRYRPELRDAVQDGKLQVWFWTQPFGRFDSWGLAPGLLIVTYGVPQQSMAEYYREDAEAIAERAKALSDPTRLLILRIIRNFGMDNTQMADYFGIARPTVSVHAKVLREAGLIETRQEGRAALHSLNARAVRQLFRDLEHFLQLPEEDETEGG